ncbi:MAG: hypothetical protein WC969_12545 [Elusimicrobiota bacterium]|jgi:hypothetical protein
MRLYFNDALLSGEARPEDLPAAVERLRAGKEDDRLELRRDERVKLAVRKADGVGGAGYYLELWWGDMLEGYCLPGSARAAISAALRDYLAGRTARPESGTLLEPDCPLCAMLAEQMKR